MRLAFTDDVEKVGKMQTYPRIQTTAQRTSQQRTMERKTRIASCATGMLSYPADHFAGSVAVAVAVAVAVDVVVWVAVGMTTELYTGTVVVLQTVVVDVTVRAFKKAHPLRSQVGSSVPVSGTAFRSSEGAVSAS